MEILGGCLCRATRYRSTAPPIVTRVCWCRVCQYFAAGNGTVNVCFTRTAVNHRRESPRLPERGRQR